MLRASAVALTFFLVAAFVSEGTAWSSYHTPRQLPWLVGISHDVSGYTYNCGGHNRLTATSASAWNAHYYGIDFGLEFGNQVSSVAVGRVEVREFNEAYGNRIVIDHGSGVHSIYAHLGTETPDTGFEPGIVEGRFVPQNTIIGYAGYSGFTIPDGPDGTHLHFHMQIGLSAYLPEPLSGVTGFVSYCLSPSPVFTSSQAQTDSDGYPDNHENYFGTGPAFDCPFTSFAGDEAIDNWPPDFDDNRVINTTDVFQLLSPHLGSFRDAAGNWSPGGSDRQDLAPSGSINTTDTFHVLPPNYGSSCTP